MKVNISAFFCPFLNNAKDRFLLLFGKDKSRKTRRLKRED
jgi:hypothetical protein